MREKIENALLFLTLFMPGYETLDLENANKLFKNGALQYGWKNCCRWAAFFEKQTCIARIDNKSCVNIFSISCTYDD